MSRFVKGTHRVVSVKPVEVTVDRDEGFFIAYNETLQIWAADESAEGAIQDFTEQVIHFYFHYRKKSADTVTGIAAKLRTIYSDNFREA